MGMYFEDFEVGQEFLSPARTITEADVVQFAALSGDYNPLHTDAEYARETQFGERIAHGLLGLAIASGLTGRLGLFEGTALAFLGVDWRFTGPIFFGDTIRVKIKIAEKREAKKPDRGIIIRDTSVVNQRGEVVQQGKITIMVKRKNT